MTLRPYPIQGWNPLATQHGSDQFEKLYNEAMCELDFEPPTAPAYSEFCARDDRHWSLGWHASVHPPTEARTGSDKAPDHVRVIRSIKQRVVTEYERVQQMLIACKVEIDTDRECVANIARIVDNVTLFGDHRGEGLLSVLGIPHVAQFNSGSALQLDELEYLRKSDVLAQYHCFAIVPVERIRLPPRWYVDSNNAVVFETVYMARFGGAYAIPR